MRYTNQCILILVFLITFHEQVDADTAASTAYLKYDTEITFLNKVNMTSVDVIVLDNFKTIITNHVNHVCSLSETHGCTGITGDAVTIETDTTLGNSAFNLVFHVKVRNIADAHVVKDYGDLITASDFNRDVFNASNALTNSAVFSIVSQPLVIVETDGGRPIMCGDSVTEGGEECDDGNVVSGDGCSSDCKLEDGFMCSDSWRAADSPNAPGYVYQVSTVNSTEVFTVTSTVEGCSVEQLCEQGDLWQPELWQDKYAPGVVLPPRGYYCKKTCGLFDVPRGYQVNTLANEGTTCALKDLDECIFGLAACDFFSYCTNVGIEVSEKGYTCQCDKNYFVTRELGASCSDSGFEISILVAGKENYDPLESPLPDISVMNTIRENFFDKALLLGFFESTMSKEILMEGVAQYPPELVRVMTETGYTGRALWKLKIRLASELVKVAAFVGSSMFTDVAVLDEVLTDTNSPSAYKLFKRGKCSNDVKRVCEQDSDCLSATCSLNQPEITVESLSAGGSSAPIYAESNGMTVISSSYDNSMTGFHVRLRYTPSESAMSVLYASHISKPTTASQMSTFLTDEFPCLPMGTGDYQLRRDSTVCCLNTFDSDYTTVDSFGPFINSTEHAIGAAIHGQGKCKLRRDAPSTVTRDLINGTMDFVTGKFNRMSRSEAVFDPVETVGYKDINVFLAYEDIVLRGGIVKDISGGTSLRFFVGMAHFRGLDSTDLSVSFSQTEIKADITNTFVFSTSSQTDFTFIKDVFTDLISVQNQTSGDFLNFVRVGVAVPDSVKADDLVGLIPHTGITARVGYTKESAELVYYPCVNVYPTDGSVSATKTEFDTLLQEQSYCSFTDALCRPLGPVPVNTGGMITFILPLLSDSYVVSDGIFTKSLYLDFILSVKDPQTNQRILTNVQTNTEITTKTINKFCTEKKLESSIEDMFQLDMHLGLTPNASAMEESLVSAYDILSNGGSVHLTRDVSSKSSNVLTFLVKGKDDVFSRSYSKDYTLVVEDMLTIHFLNADKKAQVETLIANDMAVKRELVEGSVSEINLRATEQLLQICPIQAVMGQFGCMTRYEIKSRDLDKQTHAIVNIAPDVDEGSLAQVLDNAGRWTQKLLGDSEFANNLGYNHARTILETENLNRRYRKGFMVSPVIPWKQTEMMNEGFASSIELAQSSITFALIAFTQNLGVSYEPIAEIAIPGKMPIPVDQFKEDLELQGALASAYANGLGVPESSVSIDPDSIRQEIINTTDASRRLLEIQTNTIYECVVKFYEAEEDEETGQSLAKVKAEQIIDEITAEDSVIADIVFEKVVQAVSTVCKACELPKKEDVKPPKELREVLKEKVKEVAGCYDPQISVDLAPLGGGTASCTARTIDGVEYPVSVRGPMNDSEWQLVGGYDLVSDSSEADATVHRAAGLKQYDFCGKPPAHWKDLSWDNTAESDWNSIKGKFSSCCMCKSQPKHPGTKNEFVMKYSWVYNNDEVSELDVWNDYSDQAEELTLMNPQIDTFRDAGEFSVNISKQNLPPPQWTFKKNAGSKKFSFEGGFCEDGKGLNNFNGECEQCPLGTFRSAISKKKIACTSCLAAFGEASHRSTDNVGLSTGDIDGTPCMCDRGYFAPTARVNAAGSPSQFICEPCPMDTYKSVVSDDGALCLPCPEGFVSRAASTDASACILANSVGDYTAEMHAYDSIIGLMSHTFRVQDSWTNPRPQYQDNSRRCAVSSDGTALDCPGATLPNIYSTAVTASAIDNQLKLINFGASDNVPGLVSFVGDPTQNVRYQVAMQPGAGNKLTYENWYERDDLKGTAAYVSLKLRKNYGGPKPPGMVQKILDGSSMWPKATKINYKLRVDVPGVNLDNSNQTVHVVTFISKRILESNNDWQWLLCATKDGALEICSEKPDPDHPSKQNFKNVDILTGTIFSLRSTKSCFKDIWWLEDCVNSVESVGKDRYDSVFEWAPFVDAGNDLPTGDFYLYTVFFYGTTQQCLAYECDETRLYANMDQHLSETHVSDWDAEVRFLPGTEVTLQTKPDGMVYESMYETSLGVVSSVRHEHAIPATGVDAMVFDGLEKTTAEPLCDVSSDGITMTCGDNTYPNIFKASLLDQKTPISLFSVDFIELAHVKKCCDDDTLSDSCHATFTECYPGLKESTSVSTDEETYVKLHDEIGYDVDYLKPSSGSVTCSSSGLATAESINKRTYADRGPTISACDVASEATIPANHVLVPGGSCFESETGVKLTQEEASGSTVKYAMTIPDASPGVDIATIETKFGTFVKTEYSTFPTAECASPRITSLPCKISHGSGLHDYVFLVYIDRYRKIIAAGAVEGRMESAVTLIRVQQTASAMPKLQEILGDYTEINFEYYKPDSGCGTTCTEAIMQGIDVTGEYAPHLMLHHDKPDSMSKSCDCVNMEPISGAEISNTAHLDFLDGSVKSWTGTPSGVPKPDILQMTDFEQCFATDTCERKCPGAAKLVDGPNKIPGGVTSKFWPSWPSSFQSHESQFYSIQIDPSGSGNVLVTARQSPNIHLFNLNTMVAQDPIPSTSTNANMDACWAPDGNTAYIVMISGGNIKMLDVANLQVNSFFSTSTQIHGCKVTADGSTLILFSKNNYIWELDIATKTVVKTYSDTKDFRRGAVTKDGSTIVALNVNDKHVYKIDRASGVKTQVSNTAVNADGTYCHMWTPCVWAIDLGPEDQYAYTMGGIGLKRIDLKTGEVKKLSGKSTYSVPKWQVYQGTTGATYIDPTGVSVDPSGHFVLITSTREDIGYGIQGSIRKITLDQYFDLGEDFTCGVLEIDGKSEVAVSSIMYSGVYPETTLDVAVSNDGASWLHYTTVTTEDTTSEKTDITRIYPLDAPMSEVSMCTQQDNGCLFQTYEQVKQTIENKKSLNWTLSGLEASDTCSSTCAAKQSVCDEALLVGITNESVVNIFEQTAIADSTFAARDVSTANLWTNPDPNLQVKTIAGQYYVQGQDSTSFMSPFSVTIPTYHPTKIIVGDLGDVSNTLRPTALRVIDVITNEVSTLALPYQYEIHGLCSSKTNDMVYMPTRYNGILQYNLANDQYSVFMTKAEVDAITTVDYPRGCATSNDGYLAVAASTTIFEVEISNTANVISYGAGITNECLDLVYDKDETHLYVQDYSQIQKIKRGEPLTASVFSGLNFENINVDGNQANARHLYPRSMVFSPDFNTMYVLTCYAIKKIDMTADVTSPDFCTTIVGNLNTGTTGSADGDDGLGLDARFQCAESMDIASNGAFLIVAEKHAKTVRRVSLGNDLVGPVVTEHTVSSLSAPVVSTCAETPPYFKDGTITYHSCDPSPVDLGTYARATYSSIRTNTITSGAFCDAEVAAQKACPCVSFATDSDSASDSSGRLVRITELENYIDYNIEQEFSGWLPVEDDDLKWGTVNLLCVSSGGCTVNSQLYPFKSKGTDILPPEPEAVAYKKYKITDASSVSSDGSESATPAFEYLDFHVTDSTELENFPSAGTVDVSPSELGLTFVVRFEVYDGMPFGRQMLLNAQHTPDDYSARQFEIVLNPSSYWNQVYLDFIIRDGGNACGDSNTFDLVKLPSVREFWTFIVRVEPVTSTNSKFMYSLYDGSGEKVQDFFDQQCLQNLPAVTYSGIYLGKSGHKFHWEHYYDKISHAQIYNSVLSNEALDHLVSSFTIEPLFTNIETLLYKDRLCLEEVDYDTATISADNKQFEIEFSTAVSIGCVGFRDTVNRNFFLWTQETILQYYDSEESQWVAISNRTSTLIPDSDVSGIVSTVDSPHRYWKLSLTNPQHILDIDVYSVALCSSKNCLAADAPNKVTCPQETQRCYNESASTLTYDCTQSMQGELMQSATEKRLQPHHTHVYPGYSGEQWLKMNEQHSCSYVKFTSSGGSTFVKYDLGEIKPISKVSLLPAGFCEAGGVFDDWQALQNYEVLISDTDDIATGMVCAQYTAEEDSVLSVASGEPLQKDCVGRARYVFLKVPTIAHLTPAFDEFAILPSIFDWQPDNRYRWSNDVVSYKYLTLWDKPTDFTVTGEPAVAVFSKKEAWVQFNLDKLEVVSGIQIQPGPRGGNEWTHSWPGSVKVYTSMSDDFDSPATTRSLVYEGDIKYEYETPQVQDKMTWHIGKVTTNNKNDLTWTSMLNAVTAQGGRLPTTQEIQSHMKVHGPFGQYLSDGYTGDMYVPTTNENSPSGKDRVQVGRRSSNYGWDYVSYYPQNLDGLEDANSHALNNYNRYYVYIVEPTPNSKPLDLTYDISFKDNTEKANFVRVYLTRCTQPICVHKDHDVDRLEFRIGILNCESHCEGCCKDASVIELSNLPVSISGLDTAPVQSSFYYASDTHCAYNASVNVCGDLTSVGAKVWLLPPTTIYFDGGWPAKTLNGDGNLLFNTNKAMTLLIKARPLTSSYSWILDFYDSVTATQMRLEQQGYAFSLALITPTTANPAPICSVVMSIPEDKVVELGFEYDGTSNKLSVTGRYRESGVPPITLTPKTTTCSSSFSLPDIDLAAARAASSFKMGMGVSFTADMYGFIIFDQLLSASMSVDIFDSFDQSHHEKRGEGEVQTAENTLEYSSAEAFAAFTGPCIPQGAVQKQTMRACPEAGCATDTYTLAVDAGAYKLDDVSGADTPRLQVRKGYPTTISWPDTHPVVISATSTWGSSAVLFSEVSTLETVVTVPEDSTLTHLYYYCQNHQNMPMGTIDVIAKDGVPDKDVTCTKKQSWDFSAQQASFTFSNVDNNDRLRKAGLNKTKSWVLIENTFHDFDGKGGHLFSVDPESSAAWSDVYETEASVVSSGAFVKPTDVNSRVKNQFDTLALGITHAHENKVHSIDLTVIEGYMGGGGSGFYQKIDTTNGWPDGKAIEYQLQLSMPSLFDENPKYFEAWKESKNVHMTTFLTDKILDASEFNWIVCGQKQDVPDELPVPHVTLHSSNLIGFQPPHSTAATFSVSYKTNALFSSQNGWVSNIPGFSDPHCDPSSGFSQECKTDYTSTIAAMGWPKCDLAADLAGQEDCVYTVGDVMDHYFYKNVNRYALGTGQDKLTLMAGSLTRNMDQRTPQLTASLKDTAPVLLTGSKGSVCHMDHYGAHIDGGSRFLPMRDFSLTDNPETGLDNKGTLLHPGYDGMPCSISTGFLDSAAEEAYLASTPLATVLDLFEDKKNCICGLMVNSFVVDGTFTRDPSADTPWPPSDATFRKQKLKIERTDRSMENGHGYVFATPVSTSDATAGHVLARAEVNSALSVDFYKSDPKLASVGSTSKKLPAEYKICQDEPDPDGGGANLKNPHVLDARVIPLESSPRPTFLPGIDGLTPGSFRQSVRWPQERCSYIKPSLTVTDSISSFKFKNGPTALKNSVRDRDIGVIDATGRYFEWFYPYHQISDTGVPQFSNTCVNDGNNLPVSVPCAYTYDFYNIANPASNIFENEFLDLVFLKEKGWTYVWFGMFKDETSHYYVRELSGTLHPGSVTAEGTSDGRYVFKKRDMIIGGREGTGMGTDECPVHGDYKNQLGVLSWTPTLASTPTSMYLYTMFTVGDSVACKNYACDEAQAYSDMPDIISNTNFKTGVHGLVVMQGSRVSLKHVPEPPFQLADNCLKVLFVGTSFLNGNILSTYYLDRNVATFLQDYGEFETCENCVGGVCGQQTLPCKFYDTSGFTIQGQPSDPRTYYTIPAITSQGSHLLTFWQQTESDATSSVTYLEGHAVTAPGFPSHSLATDVSWAADDFIYTTSAQVCSDAGSRRRSLPDAVVKTPRSPLRKLHQARAKRNLARKAAAKTKTNSLLNVRLQRSAEPQTMRRLLTVNSEDQLKSSTSVERETTSVNNDLDIAQGYCSKNADRRCVLLNIDGFLDRTSYCKPESELIAYYNQKIETLLANTENPSEAKIRIVSIYRPSFLSTCFGSNVYTSDSRRLLTVAKEKIVLTGHTEAKGCGDHELTTCQLIIPLKNFELQDLEWGDLQLKEGSADPMHLATLCLGECNKNSVELFLNSSKPAGTETTTTTESNTQTIIIVVVCVCVAVIVIGLVLWAYFRKRSEYQQGQVSAMPDQMQAVVPESMQPLMPAPMQPLMPAPMQPQVPAQMQPQVLMQQPQVPAQPSQMPGVYYYFK